MQILTVTPTEINWHSGLPVFASEPFLKSVSDEYGWLGGHDSSGQLRCVLPYTVIRKPGFHIIRFRTETIPLADLAVEEEMFFLDDVVRYFRRSGADMIIPATNTALFRTYPNGAVAAPYGTFIKNLDKGEDILWSELHGDCQQNIRKATKAGLRIRSGKEHLETAYHLIADTLRRSGVKFRSSDEFGKILLSLGDKVRIFLVEQGGIVQACMVSPFSLHSAYDWYSGTIGRPSRGAMNLLLWQAMLEFQALGVKQFNFTGIRINPEKGSKQEGIWNFKMRFGGRQVQGYMWKYSLRPIKFAAYSLAVRLLRGGDIVDVERHKLERKVSQVGTSC
ncbi:MAG: hypothetical protein DMG48_13855 [Acidobacteria bacterium]|nr:MAG: hypothetical protein DMG48_13855 [Acidobacteriota bacterium]